jgi:uncharacterized membrane protein YtjA (UPF0391 family)
MLRYALIFLIVALVAGGMGFWGISGAASSIAMTLFYVFLIVTVIMFILGMGSRRSI